MTSSTSQATPQSPPDPLSLLRSRGYVTILVVAALLGAPVALVSYWFLQLATHLQQWMYDDLPEAAGLGSPAWWPVPVLVTGGVLVALTVRYLPGHGGETPADGFRAGRGVPTPVELVGIALAALATLGFGAVLGPEAPLIAIGGGLAAGAVRLLRRDAPSQAVALIGAAGSFAAISTLLGSPLPAAFLLMEIAGIGGAMTSLMLAPGLLAAGIGSLVFIGLDSLTGLGTTSLAVSGLPSVGSPTLAEFGWAFVIGAAAALLGSGIRRIGLALKPVVERRLLLATPAVGLLVAVLAVGYGEVTDKSSSDVLFSGQEALGPLVAHSAEYSLGTLLLLVACKGLAYGLCLSSFRGGPIFPAMFIGAAGGVAMGHLPGLATVSGAAMGIGAMCVAMLGYPLVSVLLATLLLMSDGLEVMPLVIVAVVVSYVGRAWLDPAAPQEPREPQDPPPRGT
ncbi:chloride channel protein [Nocardioides koreensis]|uniref:Chloride channel protein n=1 Tax=Nocardioides koreensis TaxID=433651 RepID=A0ABP5LTV3_9ACTN